MAAADPLTQPLLDFLPPAQAVPVPAATEAAPGTEATWPCTRCDTANPLSAAVCSRCGGGFLAGIRDNEQPLLVLPIVGDLGAMSRGRRLGLALALVAAVVLPLALLTLLLTQRPDTAPDNAPGTTVSSTTG